MLMYRFKIKAQGVLIREQDKGLRSYPLHCDVAPILLSGWR
jgi:hypothetical protein